MTKRGVYGKIKGGNIVKQSLSDRFIYWAFGFFIWVVSNGGNEKKIGKGNLV